jgi:large subunit ribosomal protein L24
MYNAPNHIKSSRIGAMLSNELREKYGVRSVRIRKDDSVKVLRGEFKGVEGKVTKIHTESCKINVEGVNREKIAGGNIPIKIHASNVVINTLNLDDRWRKNKLEKGEK